MSVSIDGDGVSWECLRHSPEPVPLVVSPHRHFRPEPMRGSIGSCDSSYDCKTDFRNNHQGLKKMFITHRTWRVQGMPRAIQDWGERESKSESKQTLDFAFFGVKGGVLTVLWVDSLLVNLKQK